MKAVGIIAEYNPFHNGHAAHLAAARKLAETPYSIIIMSGSFVQRGEPAQLDKWTRTRMALSQGASMVIELPTPASTASSEFFAEAGVRLLAHTGVVRHICFGTESMALTGLSQILAEEPADYRAELNGALSEGMGFAAARARALSRVTGCEEALLHRPNTILSLEYLKANIRLGSPLIPLPVLRSGDYHTSADPDAPSATYIRKALREGRDVSACMPASCLEALEKAPLAAPLDDWSDLLYDRLLHLQREQLAGYRDVEEGLESRILRIFSRKIPISEGIDAISTKRYPKSRIRRILLSVLLDIKKESLTRDPGYLRVLGFRKDAEGLLKALTDAADVPVITNLSRQLPHLPADVRQALEAEIIRTDQYFAHVPGSPALRGAELTQPIITL